VRTGGHTVVVGKDEIDARLAVEDGVEGLFGRLPEPSGIGCSHDVYARSVGQGVHQSAMAVARWGRTL